MAYLEDVKVQPGETMWGLASAYGHGGPKWRTIWDHPKNAGVVAKRGKPEKLEIGDIVYVPIPWKVTSKVLTAQVQAARFTVKRDGQKGTRLRWAQTVNRGNQPIGPNPDRFCVDACTPDDSLPFYWTEPELTTKPDRRKEFFDRPSRSKIPTAAMGTTKWRAIVSIAVVTDKRVTVYDSLVWGFDLKTDGTTSTIGPRVATATELAGHLNLLKKGVGTAKGSFTKLGWAFRSPPVH